MRKSTLVIALFGVLLLAGCRGTISDKPPIHINPNMDIQNKFDPQEANPFFADGRAMRPPVPGTVARGMLKEDTRFYLGREEGGSYVQTLPIPVTTAVMQRGQQRYDIYCAVCHGKSGDGQGIIMTGGYGYTPAPSYHDDRLRGVENGYLYEVITNGVRNMPGYAQQISVADRWAIVAYLRALQRSQNATEADIPASELANIEQGSTANIGGGRTGNAGSGQQAATDTTNTQ